MSNVVHLKTRGESRMEAADEEVGRMLVDLGNRYGVHLIVTVVMRYMAESIVCVVCRGGAREKAWLKDIARLFHKALKGRL
jgi:hypothetical protein